MNMSELTRVFVAIGLVTGATCVASAEPTSPLPVIESVIEGFERVRPADGGDRSLWDLYYREESQDLVAVLPSDYDSQPFLLTNALSRGDILSGIQGDTYFLRFRRIGNRLGFVEPQLNIRTTGDLESARSVDMLYADHVRFDVPIVAESPDGRLAIDLDELFVDRWIEFLQVSPGALDPKLGSIPSVKVFAENINVTVELPLRARTSTANGLLITMTYSIMSLASDPEYVPREADHRVGYFAIGHDDLARVGDKTRVRYVKRWKLEKADPSLAMSPPREPIVFYIDHKTPVRYRRWVREGVLAWNRAFEKVGIVGAIEAYQQDAQTGTHMEKQPEDVAYNFVVWNSNDISFAIGPSRSDPRTGQILDADVVMNDGWIRAGVRDYREVLAEASGDGMSAPTRAWLADHPEWDPRLRLRGAHPDAPRGEAPGDKPVVRWRGEQFDPTAEDGCRYAGHRAMDIAMARLSLLDVNGFDRNGTIEDVPQEFIGQLVRDVIMHEIGHVLGLRHNFKASTVYSLDQINSQEWADERLPISGSVMDYNAFNYNAIEGRPQGPHFMETLGPYDVWAIRYGYGADDDLEEILELSTLAEHVYLTDEDMYGPDPAARTRDLGRDPLNFTDQEMALTQRLRREIGERALKEGGSFQEARSAYFGLQYLHNRALATAARYVGGIDVRRDRVGDAERAPTEVIAPETQRRALGIVIRYAFADDAFGLNSELLELMSYDKWFDGSLVPQNLPDPQLSVHELVLGVQATALTSLINPTTLERIIDNEHRARTDEDAFTMAELFAALDKGIWVELTEPVSGPYTPRQPRISSLRRNLQREYLDRMIDLTMPDGMAGSAGKPVAALALHRLRQLESRIDGVLRDNAEALDEYSIAHLEDARRRIESALSAVYSYN